MTSLATILRDLARTAIRAAGRGGATDPSGRAQGAGHDIRIPDLATVDETRRAQRDAEERDRTAQSAPAPPTSRDAPRRTRQPAPPPRAMPPPPPEPWEDDGVADDATRDRHRMDHDDDGLASAGQVGPAATVDVDPGELEVVGTAWDPDTDGDPDPGEVVWTWVPYEEADGRGKDRPVVVVARLADDAVLAVQLSSRDHDGDDGWVALGAGDWDGAHHPSWVNLDRVLLVRPAGMRREAAILDAERFALVADALAARHGWGP